MLDTTLFYRSSRGVSLTAEGRLLFEQLESAFASISYGEEQIRKIGRLGIGQITIGVSTTLCKYVLLPYLQKFIRENPHIRVSIACQPTAETIRNLQNGSIDIGLIGESRNMKELAFYPVMEIQDAFVTTKRYLTNLSMRLDIQPEFAKIDMGIACVIENFIAKELTAHTLIKLPLARQIPGRKIGFAYKKQANLSVPLEKFQSMFTAFPQ